MNSYDILGKMVTVTVDRPLGTYHPRHKTIFYTVNYGYVEGIIAGDGAEQDAYILGIDIPVKSFTGKVIAVVHRLNDVEDKWIVVPEDIILKEEDIKNAVNFQEQFFTTEYYCLYK
ncbi:inorganic pyrophosphatase [Clostridium folliculivorans]|uniref:Inorganic pyrophosphatase n=1 Tax=Clostridium folliculivorans TaxID=2886038 RepID=A0A9W6DAC9_9CLOT|nr:inorganic pyrophosphatase [Clostridium folliculivorans]GKU25245.1 inorganic pyrophosphatase [Clostridium folliculivorans]GKU28266.1 inorganic pyrophosphatase [Clostridium folliculivorans]